MNSEQNVDTLKQRQISDAEKAMNNAKIKEQKQQLLEEVKKKERINIVIIGHQHSGKSSVLGHLLYKFGEISQEQMKIIEKKTLGLGIPESKYAWVVDKSYEQRQQRCQTIHTSTFKLQTTKKKINFIHVPAKKAYHKNFMRGLSLADSSILVVSPYKFNSEDKLYQQAKTQAIIAFALNVKSMIVCINKIDIPPINYQLEIYAKIKEIIQKILKEIGFNIQNIQFVPISGYKGDNLFGKCSKTSWYEGPTLIEAIDMVSSPRKIDHKPLRMPISEVYQIKGMIVVVGTIKNGCLKQNMAVTIAPVNIKTQVKEIQMHHKAIKQANYGDYIGVGLLGVKTDDIKRGFILGQTMNDPPRSVSSLKVQIIITNPGKIIKQNKVYHLAAIQECLHAKLQDKDGKILQQNPNFLNKGMGMIEIRPISKMCVQNFMEYPYLGRFAVFEEKEVVGVGIIRQVVKQWK